MGLIYKPKGKAAEYSPLALNVYTGGCDHGCMYCYCKGLTRGRWSNVPTPRDLKGLAKEAARAKRQVLLSFMGDPYCHADVQHGRTREALEVLGEYGCSVAVLSKGGYRMLRDFDLFRLWPGGRIKVGATLTLCQPGASIGYEPRAALPYTRIDMLRELRDAGVRTWASIEPVIFGQASLDVISAALLVVDEYMLGSRSGVFGGYVNWEWYVRKACKLLRSKGKKIYVKKELQGYAPAGFLRPEECDPEAHFVPDRPEGLK